MTKLALALLLTAVSTPSWAAETRASKPVITRVGGTSVKKGAGTSLAPSSLNLKTPTLTSPNQLQPKSVSVNSPSARPSAPAAAQRQSPVGDVEKALTDHGIGTPAAAPAAAAAKNPPQAAASLRTATLQIQNGRTQNISQDAEMASLRKIFDAALQRSSASPSPKAQAGAGSEVAGKAREPKKEIAHQVELANTSSAQGAPQLYESAIAMAQASFVPSAALEITRSIRDFADKKAESAVPQLAFQANEAAASGSATVVAEVFKALHSWNALLSTPRSPLINPKELSRFESVVRKVLAQSKVTQSVSPAPKETVVKLLLVRRLGGPASFMTIPESITAVPVKDLAVAFALRETEIGLAAEDGFQPGPSLFQNAKFVYGYHREQGHTAPGSFVAASSYWAKSVLYGLWHGIRGFFSGLLGRRESDSQENLFVFKEISQDYEASDQFISLYGDRLKLSAALTLTSVALRMARNYEKLGGEGAAVGAVLDLRGHLETASRGLEESDVLPPSISRRLITGRQYGLRYWTERIYQVSRRRVLGAEEPAAYFVQEKPGYDASLSIEKLMEDVKKRPELAKRAAKGIGPGSYVTVGRVETGKDVFDVKSAVRVSQAGRRERVTLFLPNGSESPAFARIEDIGRP